MKSNYPRILTLVGTLFVLLVVCTLGYMVGMDWLEGQHRGFWQSMEWAAETLTTTGYGADHTWHHPLMVVYVSFV